MGGAGSGEELGEKLGEEWEDFLGLVEETMALGTGSQSSRGLSC